MEKETTDLGGVPAELLNGIDEHHLGLRHLELQQMRGRAGYQTCVGEKYTFKNGAGEPPKHDEHPSRSALEVAQLVWSVAKNTRRTIGGDQRFAVKVLNVGEDKNVKTSVIRFDVPLEEMLDDAGNGEGAEAKARSTFTLELVRYTASIHDLGARLGDKYADGMGKMFDGQARTLDRVEGMLGKIVELVEKVVELRFDAAEAEVRAELARVRGEKNEDWKQVGTTLKDIVKSPVGIAAAAQLLGLKPEDAAKMMAELGGDEEDAAKKQVANDEGYQHSIREPLDKLVKSLQPHQKAALLVGLGGSLATLQAAGKSTDETSARAKLAEFFDDLGEDGSPKWKVIEDNLDEKQRALVMLAMDRLTEAPKK